MKVYHYESYHGYTPFEANMLEPDYQSRGTLSKLGFQHVQVYIYILRLMFVVIRAQLIECLWVHNQHIFNHDLWKLRSGSPPTSHYKDLGVLFDKKLTNHCQLSCQLGDPDSVT
jgi:hypothetical protein